ncbi:MAG: hypothetical protein Q8L07_00380 [Sediminibacterium sp.]|nr:hypothetical protein [Sediminibacterium sp.]MDP1810714.1 hypothetical protein [Sediminibacterium sp.]MDP3129337.1 hypothetical protein [Sediminibacterium sp.]MDP3666503.1 hypothetical protein [Sediminibacterium sp.]
MTLIASTLNHKMPIIISDLLWSGDHTPEPVRFPTNNFDPTPYLPEDQEAKPVKLGQKMYFINDIDDLLDKIYAPAGVQELQILKYPKDEYKERDQTLLKLQTVFLHLF